MKRLVVLLIIFIMISSCNNVTKKSRENTQKSNKIYENANHKPALEKDFFPISIGNKWTYKITVVVGKIPKYSFIAEVEKPHPATGNIKGDWILYNGNAVFAKSGTETYTIFEFDNNADAFIVNTSERVIENRRCPIFDDVVKLWWHYTDDGVWENIRGRQLGEGILVFDLIAFLKPGEGKEEMETGRNRNIYCDYSNDTIIVPAGKFLHCLKNTTTQLGGQEKKLFKTISYFARNIGLVKEIQYDNNESEVYIMELVDYLIID